MSETLAGLGLGLDISQWEMAAKRADASLDQVDARARQHDGTMRKLEGAYARAASTMRTLIGLAGIGFGTQQLIRYADTWTNVNSKLALVTKSTAELQLVQKKLFDVAQNTRTSFESTVDLFSRVARSAKTLGLAQTDLLKLTQSVNQAMIISGASAGSAQAALMQLGQAFASGTLRGEELNSVLEQAPRLAEAIAVGMGKTTGELRKLGMAGKLTSEAVVKALLSQSDAIGTEYGKMQMTISQSFTKLSNSFLKFIGSQSSASGAAGMLSDAISKLADNLDRLIPLLVGFAGVKLAISIGGWVSGLAMLGGSLTGTIALLTRAVSMLGAFGTAATLAGRGAAALVAGLGGPVGLALTAVAAGFALYSKNAGDATRKTEQIREALSKKATNELESMLTGVLYKYQKLQQEMKVNGLSISGSSKAAGQLADLAAEVDLLRRVIAEKRREDALANAGKPDPKVPGLTDEAKKKIEDAKKAVEDLKKKVQDMAFEMSNPTAMQTYARSLKELEADFVKTAKEAKLGGKAVLEFRASLKSLTDTKAAQLLEELNKEIEDLRNSMTPTGRDDSLTSLNRQLKDMQQRGVPAFLRELWGNYQRGLTESTERTRLFEEQLSKLSTLKPLPMLSGLARLESELQTAVKLAKTDAERRDYAEQLAEIHRRQAGIVAQYGTNIQTATELFKENKFQLENLVRGIQGALSSAFESIFSDGLKSFTRLMESIKTLFFKIAGEMIAAKIMDKIFAKDDKGNITGLSGSLGGKKGGEAIAAGFIGYGVGSSIGGTTTNRGVGALGGALGGAASGALAGTMVLPGIGTAVGAVVGAVAGMIGGFMSSAKKAKEAAEEMRKARQQFDRDLKLFSEAAAGTTTDLALQLQQIEDQRKKLAGDAKAYLPKNTWLGKDQDQAYKTLTEMKNNGVQFSEEWEKYYQMLKKVNDGARELSARLKQEAIDSIDAQLRDAKGQGFVNTGLDLVKKYENDRKTLEQAGGDPGKAMELFQLQMKNLVSTLSDEQFKVLLESLPEQFRTMAEEARKLAQAGDDVTRVLTEQGKALLADLAIREKVLAGDYRGAAKDSLQRDIDLAVKQAKAEGLAADQIERLVKTMQGEFLAALKAAEEATQRDIQVRRLVLAGRTDEAQIVGLMIQQEQELKDARSKGLSETTIAALAALQAEERLAAIRKLEAERAERNTRLMEDLELRRAGILERLGGQDFTNRRREIDQRREIADARANGETEPQIRARKYQQELENLAAAFEAETTKMIEAITKVVSEKIAQIDAQIGAQKEKIAGFREQIASIRQATQERVAQIDAQLAIQTAALDAANATVGLLKDQAQDLRKMADSFKEFANSLATDQSLNTLSPEAYLAATKQAYDSASPDQFIDAAKQYLAAARDYFGSNESYQQIFAAVQAQAQTRASSANVAATMVEQQLAAATASANGIAATVAALQLQKETIQKAADKQIEAIEKQIEAAEKTIAELEAQRQAIIDAGNKQIEELIKTREQAFLNAVKQLEEQQKAREEIARLTDKVQTSLEDLTPVEVTLPDNFFADMTSSVAAPIVEALAAVATAVNSGRAVSAAGAQETVNRLDNLAEKFDELVSASRLAGSAPPV